MQADLQKRMQETEKKLKELPQDARQHKALIQALQSESTDLFSELVKSVNLMGTQVGELLSTHEASLGSRAEGQIQRLEQEVAKHCWKSEEMSRMAEMQDHICFLKNFLIMDLDQTGATGDSVEGQEEAAIASIRSATTEFRDSLQELCENSLAKIIRIVDDGPMASVANGAAGVLPADNSSQAMTQNTVYEITSIPPPLPPPRPQGTVVSATPPPPLPPRPQASPITTVRLVNPELQTREEMLKFRFQPTMDPNTAYRHLLLSDGDHKAKLRAENMNPPDHPERFQFWRQVLCKEPLAGSPYYWEVEWTGQKITIGVAYKQMERKTNDDQSRLGHNALSWSLYWSGTGFSFWHEDKEKLLGSPKARRVGIYLDQHAGILAFFCITNNQAHLIYRHQTQFNGPLYPGFRFWADVGAAVTVCQLD
ncbi:hypothetical protein LDENG_00073300 [Lucifuga dentata]|nr:hypothetical protein LDENG_00073300 [Lucifuga dentata]